MLFSLSEHCICIQCVGDFARLFSTYISSAEEVERHSTMILARSQGLVTDSAGLLIVIVFSLKRDCMARRHAELLGHTPS